jgi:DNA-binding IclR family transcriptional regulator
MGGNVTKEKEEPGVAAVNRALSILKAFETSVEGMTLTDLTNATGLYHSTILRLCESLEHFGFLKRLEDGRYMLGPTPFFLGAIYQGSFHLRDYALPVLRQLVKQTEETAAVYIREGDHRVCLYRLELQRSVRVHVREGERFSLDHGAAGKIIQAFSEETPTLPAELLAGVRKARYAVSVGERDAESAAISCPVFNTGNRFVCAISLGIPRYRFDADVFNVCLPTVMKAAAQLTRDLGGDPAFFEPPFAPLGKIGGGRFKGSAKG